MNKKRLTVTFIALVLYLIPLVTAAILIDFYGSDIFIDWPFNYSNEFMLKVSYNSYCYGLIISIIASVISLASSDEAVRRLFKWVWIPYLVPIAIILFKIKRR